MGGHKKDNDTPLPRVPSMPDYNPGHAKPVEETPAQPEIPLQHDEPAPEPVPKAEPQKDTHAIYEIRNQVKESLVTAGNEVKEIIINALHKEEVAKRAAAVQKVMEKIEAAEGELKKIKPKHLGVTLDGKPAGEPVYQPEDAKKHKETSELLAKLHGALNKAIKEHNFEKVFELGR